LSLGDSYGNIVYRFLKVIFIPPVILPVGDFDRGFNWNITKDCGGDEILTGNITNIDKEGLVNITYSQELYNEMFQISSIQDKANKVPRWLAETSDSKVCYIWRKVEPGSMNLTDLNST
tara:strand:+ start:192 stop:548 length:357 start_codon:yes stop_codon:yes gene_type:complete